VLAILARYPQVRAISRRARSLTSHVGALTVAALGHWQGVAGLALIIIAALVGLVLCTALWSRSDSRQRNALLIIRYLVGLLRPEALPNRDGRDRVPRRRARPGRPHALPAGKRAASRDPQSGKSRKASPRVR
jgi:hypothetical protein